MEESKDIISDEDVQKWAAEKRKIRGSFFTGCEVYGVPVNVEVNGSIVTVTYQIKRGA